MVSPRAATAAPPILVLRGSSALSAFRLDKLRAALMQSHPSILSVDGAFVHFIQASRDLDTRESEVLQQLLTYGGAPAPASAGENFLVIPRIGTISPWASKATDIAHNCGLDTVRRIERGTQFSVRCNGVMNEETRTAIINAIHDPMTETVRHSLDAAAELFVAQSPPPLTRMPLMADGVQALRRANADMGLALAADEIDYLFDYYLRIARDPTDVELMMFAQANSEHCRHKIFNASWTIDGAAKTESLFAMIRNTHRVTPGGTVVAYSDNSAVMQGTTIARFFPDAKGRFEFHEDETHILMKVETHNHPTAIAPWPGAATGSGGEIRDEGATGIGAKPKAGLTGFSVSNLNIPGHRQPWEHDYGKPARIASALAIITEGPIGGAAFNNEFGRINLTGYFRTFEQLTDGVMRGYHKPIMIAGGLGNISHRHTHKKALAPGTLLIQLGGPGMRIGLGGGAASSMTSGANTEALDFDSVQRANAEMQRRCQEVIDACWQLMDANPILSLHDVGAGGISNALPELAHGGGAGARLDLRAVPSEEPGMSPREIWSNESQERYVLAIAPQSLAAFRAICARERCPFAVLGTATGEAQLVVVDPLFGNDAVDMEMDVLLGKPPRMHRDVASIKLTLPPLDTSTMELRDAVYRVLKLPTVADKSFLITIGDRSVGGLTARDQFVGPWQVPVADCAVTLMGFQTLNGEAMAVGERAPIALVNAAASGRMAVGEAITNIAAADVAALSDIKLSANWMAAAGFPGEDARLYETVHAVGMELCPALDISIPVGKDSLSMKTAWDDRGAKKQVVAPVSLVISAFAMVQDASLTLTPELARGIDETELVLIDLGHGRNRLGASALAQVFGQVGAIAPDLDEPLHLKQFFAAIRALARDKKILAYHDRSDGGLLVTLAEMMFASHCGVTIYLDVLTFAEREADVDDYDVSLTAKKLGENDAALAALFNEELGAVLQIRKADRADVMRMLRDAGLGACSHVIGHPNTHDELRVIRATKPLLTEQRVELQLAWSETSYLIQSMRDNPATAHQEYARLNNTADPGLNATLTFDPAEDIAAPFINMAKPRIAILREQGVNGQLEMAHAFTRAGFDAIDVHMSDIISGRRSLKDFRGFAACGGFSYGDVLGAGEGWAKSILFNPRARDEFEVFFNRADAFALGVCNGCQMMSNLHAIIPGAANWPHFEKNASEQYEARMVLLEIGKSPSILFTGMSGSCLPVVTAHGEGRAVFRDTTQRDAVRWLCAANYVDNGGRATEQFPANPNGSPMGMTAFTTPDGRFTIMMPHPERVALNVNLSWRPRDWPTSDDSRRPAFSPWMRMFRNARKWVA